MSQRSTCNHSNLRRPTSNVQCPASNRNDRTRASEHVDQGFVRFKVSDGQADVLETPQVWKEHVRSNLRALEQHDDQEKRLGV